MKLKLSIVFILFSIITFCNTTTSYPFYSRTNYLGANKNIGSYNIKSIDNIDYIQMGDLLHLLQSFYESTSIEKKENTITLSKENFMIVIDLNKGIIKKYDKNLSELIKAARLNEFFLKSVSTVYNENKAIDLNDFNSKIIEKEFFPVFLIGNTFFENEIQIYRNPNNEFYVFDDAYLYKEYMDHTKDENDVIVPVNLSGKLNKRLGKITLDYFFHIVKEVYPGLESKNISLETLQSKYNNKMAKTKLNFQFNFLLKKLINEFKDDHINSLTIKGPFYGNSHNKALNKANHDTFEIEEIDNILYLKIPTFAFYFYSNDYSIEELDLFFKRNNKIIIDIRNNTGGMLAYVHNYLSNLSQKDIRYYDKFNNVVLENTLEGKSEKEREIILLINDGCYSASTYLAANLKMNNLGIVIGEKTAGGAYNMGKPFVLPDNNIIMIPNFAHVTDKDGNDFENGVDPDIYFEDKYENGHDLMLEYAIEYMNNM